VNNLFPSINLTLDDVNSSWAGLRPLIAEEGKLVSEISRKDEIFTSLTGSDLNCRAVNSQVTGKWLKEWWT
jgi:glycerol-3-phosphate dehydrogenase